MRELFRRPAQQELTFPEGGSTGQVPESSTFGSMRPTAVFNAYWRFAAERQAIFLRRMENLVGPWTQDPILQRYKFTNVYRVLDRVSQYLIRTVIGGAHRADEDVLFRILLFKLFNKIQST